MNAVELHARATPGFDERLAQTLALLRKAAARASRPHRAGDQPGRRRHGDHRPDRAPQPADPAGHARHRQAARRNAGPDSAHRAALRADGAALSPGRGSGRALRGRQRRTRHVRQRRAAQGLLRPAQARAAVAPARQASAPGSPDCAASNRSSAAEVPLYEVEATGRVKFNPLADWSWADVWHYIGSHDVPYNALHDQFFPSIGCEPCTRAVALGEDFRAGRWWWEDDSAKECGLHVNRRGRTA